MTARSGSVAKPLADARGSERSHDRKGVVYRIKRHITRSET